MDSRFPNSREFTIELDSANYLINNPLSEQEVELYRSHMKERDSFSRKVFVGVFLFSMVLIKALLSFVQPEILLPEAVDNVLARNTIFVVMPSLIIASLISAIAVGSICPVNISIDGVSYCSHLSDLDYITLPIDYSTLSEDSKRFASNISKLNRPLCSFEVNIMKVLGYEIRDKKI